MMLAVLQQHLLQGLIICLVFISSLAARPPIRAHCVFAPDEIDMHKYSAVLAVTESFRDQCREEVQANLSPLKLLSLRIRGKPILTAMQPHRAKNRKIDAAMREYEHRVEAALKSYGMAVEHFNHISITALKQPSLKRKIKLQAAHYKMAADLETNLRHELPVINVDRRGKYASPQQAKKRREPVKVQNQVSNMNGDSKVQSKTAASSNGRKIKAENRSKPLSRIERFSRSIRAIEDLRLQCRSDIQRELNGRKIPTKLMDTKVQKNLSPAARRICSSFSPMASSILADHGLKGEEFDTLMKRMRRDVFFRWGVHRELKKLPSKRR